MRKRQLEQAPTLDIELPSSAPSRLEKAARRSQQAEQIEAEEARREEEEAQLQEYEQYELPDPAEVEAELATAPNLPAVRRRIQDVARVLSSFKQLRQPGRSRSEYMERLMADLAVYYGRASNERVGGCKPLAALTFLCFSPALLQVQPVLPGLRAEPLQRGGSA